MHFNTFDTMRTLFVAMLCSLGLVSCAAAHELPDNRATLVLRDRTHLSVTLFIDCAEVLHEALAPKQKFQEFLLLRAAMSPEAFQQELARVQARFQDTTQVMLPSGARVVLTRWTWPSALSVQYALRQRAMQTVVADHDHDPHGQGGFVEVRAEAHLQRETDSVRVQFPDEFKKVMVVSYRPNQVWVEAKTTSASVRF